MTKAILIVLSLLLLAGCQKSENKQTSKGNPIGSYINEPKEAARNAGAKVEKSQGEVDEQLEDLEGSAEEEESDEAE